MDAGGSNFTVTYPIDDLVIFLGMASIYNASGDTLGEATSSKTTLGMTADLAAVLNGRYNGNPFQPWVATVAFDKDNALFVDATMDTSDDIPSDQNDFYSVAMHEFGHVLGMGSSLAYQALVVGRHLHWRACRGCLRCPGSPRQRQHPRSEHRNRGRQAGGHGRYDVAGTRSLITRLDLACSRIWLHHPALGPGQTVHPEPGHSRKLSMELLATHGQPPGLTADGL